MPSAVLLSLLATPAFGQRLSLEDPAGDAANDVLDITAVTLANRDYSVVAHVALAEMERGDVVVSVDRRHGRGVRLVTHRSSDGTVTSRLLGGAFTDRASGGELACGRLRAAWDDDASRVSLRMPSRCWNDGDYGAVRYAVLTERGSRDRDWTPDDNGAVGVSDWVARG